MQESLPGRGSRAPRWRVGPAASTLPDGREVLLRPVAVSDAAGMADFFASLGESETYYFFALGEAEAGRLALKADEALAFRLVAVGDLGGGAAVLGYAFLEWRDEGPPEFGVCLRPGSQSGGLGRVLMDHLFTSARASGVRRVYLTVHPENARALLLYQRFGFVLVGEFVNDHQGVKQYRMELDLGSHPPSLAEDVVVVAQGGVGIAGAAFRVQGALEALLGARPPLAGRPPVDGEGGCVMVSDLSAVPGASPSSPLLRFPRPGGAAWIVGLDPHRLLICGLSVDGADRAADRYATLLDSGAGEAGWRRTGRVPIPDFPLIVPANT